MAVLAEAASDVEAVHGLVLGDDVLDGAGEDVAIVRESGGKRRTIVENVLRRVFGPVELSLEGLDLRPEAEDFLLMFREGKCRKYDLESEFLMDSEIRRMLGAQISPGTLRDDKPAAECGRDKVQTYASCLPTKNGVQPPDEHCDDPYNTRNRACRPRPS
nr:hypothetical protein CFP56_47071 [Quercus suber]